MVLSARLPVRSHSALKKLRHAHKKMTMANGNSTSKHQVCLDLTSDDDGPESPSSIGLGKLKSDDNKSFSPASTSSSSMMSNTKKTTTTTTQSTAVLCNLSDSDDSDTDLLLSGGPIFDPSKQEKTAKPKTKKQREKEAAKQRRIEEKQKRLQEKLLEQATKKRRLEQAQQRMGKFAPQEIVLLVEPTLSSSTFGNELLKDLRETYSVHQVEESMGGYALQWIRKDFLDGGAKQAISDWEEKATAATSKSFHHFDRLVIVFDDPKCFLDLLRNANDDDYPRLSSWLLKLQRSWRRQHTQEPRIVLLLNQLRDQVDKDWIEHRRSKGRIAPPSHEEVQDAITWLLIEFQVECIQCETVESMSLTLMQMTRAMSDVPYRQQVTELECIRKLKASDIPVDGVLDEGLVRAKDCWIRQLQQIPQVSESKALNVAREFPTARSLWEAYQDPNISEDSKRLLLADVLAENRRNVKLSDSIYQLFTHADPNQFLN